MRMSIVGSVVALVLLVAGLCAVLVTGILPTRVNNIEADEGLAAKEDLPGKDESLPTKEGAYVDEERPIVYAEVSWALWFPDLKSLLADRDLVIVGEVVNRQSMEVNQLQFAERPPFTNHQIKVLEIVKDAANTTRKGDVITVSQFGALLSGTQGTYSLEIRDDPLMKQGEVSLLFLKAGEGGSAYGGTSPQTRFPVVEGTVYWLGDVYKDRDISSISSELRGISGRPLKEVVSDLMSLAQAS